MISPEGTVRHTIICDGCGAIITVGRRIIHAVLDGEAETLDCDCGNEHRVTDGNIEFFKDAYERK